MKILAVASELYPLAKTGGLADVAGALPLALAPLGIETRTLIPGYPSVLSALGDAVTVRHTDENLFGGPARLLHGTAAGLDLLVLDAPHLFARQGLYAGPHGDWPDNPLRFAALCRIGASIGQGMLSDWLPDAVHAHDWQAGLVPAYLHYDYQQWGSRRPGTVITVHNLAFQGQCDASLLARLGLPPQAWDIEGVEYYGSIGFLKAGLRLADRVTTVSPRYADEIRTPEHGMGLDGLLRARGDAVSGILNGIDTDIWDPVRDPHLAACYDADDTGPRIINKVRLQTLFGLDTDPSAPLFGVIGRLSQQKGMDLLLPNLPALMEAGAQFLLLGTGDASLENAFAAATRQYPGRCGARLQFDEALAHLIQGGLDVLVVPSRFEPCGLTQLCAMRYGTIPLVAAVGGLADSVPETGTDAAGFQFTPVSVERLKDGIERALDLYGQGVPGQGPAWRHLQRNGMRRPVGWGQAAAEYTALYGKIAKN